MQALHQNDRLEAVDAPADALRLGQRLSTSLYARVPGARHPVLLMRAGQRIESVHQLERLSEAGFAIDLTPAPASRVKEKGPTQKVAAGSTPTAAVFDEALEAARQVRSFVSAAVQSLHASVAAGRVPDWKSMLSASRDLANLVAVSPQVSASMTHLLQCDDYTVEHSADVAILMVAIGKTLGWADDDLELLALGGLLHDVGKAKVPQRILMKPGRPTPEEWEELRRHPEYGREMLSSCTPHCPPEVIRIAAEHHERLDGSGYPEGLRGDRTSPFSAIAAVADVFDAIVSDRVYQAGRPAREALSIIYGAGGTGYDADAVGALVRLVGVYPVGTRVILDSGARGVVVAPNPDDSTRPIVEIDTDHLGRSLAPFQLCLKGGSSRIVACPAPPQPRRG